ncbi:C2H2 finger domain-containing protein [Colletotrichum karsti]|uniref:C2H2 finger domain-containing protein n=1 Tax=Colletotrichum karsti TaxID=1095194 RepID=A0A9P6I119_9PEZI|nr:C2H2 finger domain-containing protein [Colletotrichum karsti]KAF9874104.1 C2H2 finger domain-containing protein [Colletotrichum karsti]
MQQTTRPLNQHRPSLSSASSTGLTTRQSHSRNNSHSFLSGALNANHRVTRRKSMTNTAANTAALAAAIQEAGGDKVVPIAVSSRRNTASKSAAARAAIVGSLPSPPASLPMQKFHLDGKMDVHESAIEDEPNNASGDEGDNNSQKARIRRASDGQPLVKEGSRKFNRIELKCETCGKGYKHSSCLTKHLFVPFPSPRIPNLQWEHTPEWSLTSKLLISKHQQVQLLEAASVLLAMNTGKDEADAATPPDSAKDFPSDQESASPAASGYSDERHSSADTTPPPQLEGFGSSDRSFAKSYGSASGFGRSYQSAPSTNPLVTGSMPRESGFSSHFRQNSQDQRPPSSGRNATGQEDRDLAAAVELLSCSFNSNNGRKVTLPSDAPPVPPVPAQYLDQAASFSSAGFSGGFSGGFSAGFLNSFPSRQPESFTRGEVRNADVKMEDSDSVMDDDDFDRRSRSRSDEDDDGVFGRMEE